MLTHAGISPSEAAPRDLVSIEVKVVNVFDLTDPPILKELGINDRDLLDESDESMELCRVVADYARSRRNSAILSPSAAAKGEKNLSIYIDVGPAGDLTLDVGRDRIALN
jgi:RES domain-containing protein